MKTPVIFFTLFMFMLAACAPQTLETAPAAASAVGLQPAGSATEPAATSPVPVTLAASTKDEPSIQIKPTRSAKPKGKEPQSAPTSSAPDFISTVISGRPTNTSITLNVVPANPMTLYYEYGTSPGVYPFQTAPQTAPAGAPLETLISGLQPDTRYVYRIHDGDKTGPEQTFVTQRAAGSAFTFDIQGDSHPERLNKQFDPTLYTRTLMSAAADRPDFYMTIGDDFSVDQLKTVDAETVRALYINQRQWLGLVGAPLFLVNGNHEQASMSNLNGTADDVAVWAQTARNAYYPEPAPDGFYTGDEQTVAHIGLLRDYYAFTWGDALFVVIDPYWHSPTDGG